MSDLKNDTIYLLEFALKTITDAGLEDTRNENNWVLGRDIETHLKDLKQANDDSKDAEKALTINDVGGVLPSEDDIKEAAAVTCKHRSVKLGWILGAKWMRGETLVRLRNCR